MVRIGVDVRSLASHGVICHKLVSRDNVLLSTTRLGFTRALYLQCVIEQWMVLVESSQKQMNMLFAQSFLEDCRMLPSFLPGKTSRVRSRRRHQQGGGGGESLV